MILLGIRQLPRRLFDDKLEKRARDIESMDGGLVKSEFVDVRQVRRLRKGYKHRIERE
jgi:hypothetical protein